MPSNPHERAQRLLDQAAVEGISQRERIWLDAHILECSECAVHAELSQRAIRAFGQFAFPVDPGVAMRVQEVISDRAGRMVPNDSEGQNGWIGNVAAVLLTVAGSLAMWRAVAWVAGLWQVPMPVWEIGFVTFWMAPSIAFSVLLLFRKKFIGERGKLI